MAHYQLQMFHQGERVLDVPVAWTPDNAHPPVGSIVDGKWQVVEILENDTPEVYRVRVEPVTFSVPGSSEFI